MNYIVICVLTLLSALSGPAIGSHSDFGKSSNPSQAGAGIAFGAATSWTGVGAVGGGLVAAHGVDQAIAGIRTITSGQHQSSFTSMGLQRTGVSRNTADLIDGGISIVGSGGIGIASRAPALVAPVVNRAPSVPANFFTNTRLEVQALQAQGLNRSQAFNQIRSFNSGNADGFAFHFTSPANAQSIVTVARFWQHKRAWVVLASIPGLFLLPTSLNAISARWGGGLPPAPM